jgi:hypothetical protein
VFFAAECHTLEAVVTEASHAQACPSRDAPPLGAGDGVNCSFITVIALRRAAPADKREGAARPLIITRSGSPIRRKKTTTRPSGAQSFRNHQVQEISYDQNSASSGSEIPGTTLPNQPDPFDPANLRLSQSFTETAAGVKKLLTTVPVRKPNPQDLIRVHPDPAFRDNFPVIELKDEREEYIVVADLVPALVGEFVTKALFTTINRQAPYSFGQYACPCPTGRITSGGARHVRPPNLG